MTLWKRSTFGWLVGLAVAFALAHSGASATAAANDPFYDKQRYLEQIYVPTAWETIASGGKTLEPVTVAVVDTGVDLDHVDLRGKLTAGTNVLQPKKPPQDDNGHGTAVAGVIAAAAGNGHGIAGIAPNARIMPVKAVGAKGVGEEEHLGQGIRYAVDNGADIIVLSLGLHLYSPYLSDIVEYAESKGVLLVAATGNEGKTVRYPAAYPTVVAVGGATLTGEYKPMSNYGPEVDLLAPWFVYTTGLGNSYVEKEGTSMAAPQVAAVAALMLGLDPTLTPGDVRERLRQSAQPLGGIWNETSGYGLLRADKALTIVPKPDMYEPNNRKEEAKPTSTVGLVRGFLQSASDVDWFAFDPPYKGDVSVTVRGPNGGAIAAEIVLDQGAGKSPKTFDASDGKAVRLPSADGKKVLAAVRPKAGSPGGVPYEMITDFHIYADAFEPNDKAYQAYRMAEAGSTAMRGTFHQVDDQDWFAVKFSMKGTLSLKLETDTWRIDPELYVVRDGETQGQTYDEFNEGEPELTGDIQVSPGTYFIRVRNSKALFPLPVAGEYKLTATFQKRYSDAFEPNDRSYQATTLAPNQTYRGVFDSAKDEDWFQFRLRERSLVTVFVNGVPLDRYMYYALFTSGSKKAFERTSPFGKTSMRLVHELEAGVYYIRLKTDAAFQYQQYGVSFDAKRLVAGFADIEHHWAQASIERMVAKGVVAGYDDYRFAPNRTLTRAEAAAFLVRAFQLKAVASAKAFPDVPRSHWARGAIAAAASADVVHGYPDGTFRPNDTVTRAEMAVMTAIASGVEGVRAKSPGFADVPLAHWAAPYIYALEREGTLQGYKDGAFRPNGEATRAEFMALLDKLLR